MGLKRGLLLNLCLVAGALAQTASIQLTKVAGGVTMPTFITGAGDNSGRLFVTEQGGRIRIIRNGAVLPTPFLDISSRLTTLAERGLLSVAFPPDYASSGQFYVYYTVAAGDIAISRFHVSASSPDVADPSSETILLTIPHRDAPNHNGGQLQFGPDGYLYFGTGDGGGSGGQFGNSQNPGVLLAKLLRIDVSGNGATYKVPPDNPFVGQASFRPEIWAWGLRNPWRFSFDRLTHDLYIADVGQDAWEEVDFAPGGDKGGENYGWNIMEGAHCFNGAACSPAGLTLPVFEYDHSAGDCAVTGGYVYRGTRYPGLQGTYIFSDFCTGTLRTLQRNGSTWQNGVALRPNLAVSTMGEDDTGELYLADYKGGDIYNLTMSGGPSFGVNAVVSAASYEAGLSPGSIAAVFGSGFTSTVGITSSSGTLPKQLAGASVKVNGVSAPLYAVAHNGNQDQINFQTPYELIGSATAMVVVSSNGADSPPVQVNVLPALPALFTIDGSRAVAQHADWQVVTPASPAARDEVVVLWATGLGAVDNQPATGALASASALSRTTTMPVVTIGGQNAPVDFAGLAPGMAGLYQMNVHIPPGAATGDQDLIISVAGRASRAARIAVGQ